MRKLFWYSVAAVVLAALGAYLAADYASRYPHSAVGHGVLLVYNAGVRHGPIEAVNGAAYERTYEQIQQTMADPRNALHAMPESEPHAVLMLTPRTLGRIMINEEEESLSLDVERLCPVPATINGGAEEAEGGSMPTCPDDVQVPAYMPHADEEMPPVGQAVFDTFWGLFPKAAPNGSDAGGPPMCQVDPNDVYHYPGCPSMHSYQHPPCCPYTGKSANTAPVIGVPHCEYSEESELQDSEVGQPANLSPKTGSSKGYERGNGEDGPQKGLDTMEFRKSDRRHYEIDYIPY
jgi:hypothetical protein